MAKGRPSNDDKAPSLMGEFRQIFLDNPKFLKTRSNAQVAALWLENHPEYADLPESAKSSLANVKSVLRSKKRKRKKDAAAASGTAPAQAPAKVKTPGLVALETQIDDCLIFAKSLDRAQLESVIKQLHRARNEVVWMMGS